jgi:hypothetical protein
MWPALWGSCFHDNLKLIALSFPNNPTKESKIAMELMITNMFKVLPCPACSHHAINYEKKNPVIVENGTELFLWLVTFHNDINRRTGKKHDWTVQEGRAAIIERYFSDAKDLSRAQKIRVEDHRLLMKIKVENKMLRKKLNLPIDVADNDVSETVNSVIDISLNSTSKIVDDDNKNDDDADFTKENSTNLTIVNVVISAIMLILIITVMIFVLKKKT